MTYHRLNVKSESRASQKSQPIIPNVTEQIFEDHLRVVPALQMAYREEAFDRRWIAGRTPKSTVV